jgi:Protein of unknown function (DUF3237)
MRTRGAGLDFASDTELKQVFSHTFGVPRQLVLVRHSQRRDEGKGMQAIPMIRTQYAFTARVSVAPAIVVGPGPRGLRRFVPIVGGTVIGPLLTGKVLAAGGDSQVARADGVLEVEARYLIETEDGHLVAVVNRGLRLGTPEVIARLNRGDQVLPDEYYFRTAAQFEALVSSPYEWLNRAVFVATAEREVGMAIVHFFRVL